jgi:hypothetical protein
MQTEQDEPPIFSDLTLSRRLERAEGRGCVDYVETRARLHPDSGARWIEVAGAYAADDGATSPITQTFGLGLFDPVTGANMEALEAFFLERGSPVYHEVSPLADPQLPALLNERGYQAFEFTSVMFRPLRSGLELAAPRNEKIRVRLVQEEDQELWARTVVLGWIGVGESDQLLELMRISARRPGALAFLAELEGQPVAAAVMSLNEGIALLGGASTIPEARQQGAQLALLESRLRWGAEAGCDLAMMCAQPVGGSSQRNAERHGFRIAYTRIKWHLPRES